MRPLLLGLAALALSACQAIGVAPATSASPATSSPSAAASPAASLPERVWVNASLGANVRADHSTEAAKLGLVRQGAELRVTGAWPTPTPQWYRVMAEDVDGWISARVVVPAHIQRTGASDLVTVALPDGLYGVISPSNPREFVVRSGPQPSDPIFLRVRKAATDAELPVTAPGVVDYRETVEVWNYTAEEQVFRRPDGSAYYVIRVPGEGARYLVEFFDATTNSPRVRQVLESMALF